MMGEFVTAKECSAYQNLLITKIENLERAVTLLRESVIDFTQDLTQKTEKNGQQNVTIERLSGRIATLEKESGKAHNWALYLFVGALTLLNVAATVMNYFK